MKNEIKISLISLYVKKDGRFWGKARWLLDVKADANQLGDPKEVFVVKNGTSVTFSSDWSLTSEVERNKEVKITFHAKEKARVLAKDFGNVTHKLKWPFSQQSISLENKYFRVKFGVQLKAQGVFKKHDPQEVFACRSTAANPLINTVSGAHKRIRIEVCEVRPTPPTAKLPARIGPPVTGKVTFKSTTGINIKSTDDINKIPNPAVIPVIAKVKATKKNAARIEVNYFEPQDIKLTDTDARLQWKISGVGGAEILGSDKGMGIYVYGSKEGEIKLTLTFLGAEVAIYRALVLKEKIIKCRANLFDGGAGFKTDSSDADVIKHIAVANIILRQSGVKIELDSSNNTSDGGVKLKTGIFRVPLDNAKKGRARNLSSNFPRAIRMNYKPKTWNLQKVLNLVYVVSMSSASTLGQAIARPLNTSQVPAGGSFPQLKDSGTPATSWINPSGVYPHPAATEKTLEMMNAKIDPKDSEVWAVTICNGNSTELQYGNTLAHEICHALGLAHRELTQDLLPELNQNLMHANEGPVDAQDLDIIQSKAIQKSPMLSDTVSPAPPPPPSAGNLVKLQKKLGVSPTDVWDVSTEDAAKINMVYKVTSGGVVEWVQTCLNNAGMNSGTVDSICGPITKGAIERYQDSKPSLTKDGVAGPRTMQSLAGA